MRRRLIAALAAVAIALISVVPALAKEGLVARLDAPIPMGEPGGTLLRIGLTVTAPDAGGGQPVYGSPIYVKLTGPSGDSTWEAAAARGQAGHYVATIVIPPGGARAIEVGLHGTSDLAILVAGEVFAFGRVTARTAQVAVPSPALAALPRTMTPVVHQGAQDRAGARAGDAASPGVIAGGSATDQGAATGGDQDAIPLAPFLVALAALVLVLALAAARRARRRTGSPITATRPGGGTPRGADGA